MISWRFAPFGRHAFGRFKLGRMALAIAHGQRIGFEAGRVGHGEDGGGIKAAGKQNDARLVMMIARGTSAL
jgi:hypothetical protein